MKEQTEQKFLLLKDRSPITELMKTLKILMTVVQMFVVMVISIGCKKNNDEKHTCRVITVNFYPTLPLTGTIYRLSYNSDGKLSRVVEGANVTTYAYTGNTAIATVFEGGTFIRKNIITLNAAGMASNIRTEYDATGNNWHNKVYEYNGTELIKSTLTFSSGNTSTSTTHTWSNGNMVRVVAGTVTRDLDYYLDKPNQAGAAFNPSPLLVHQFLEGYEIYRTKNLLKSFSPGETLLYDFRPDGNVSSVSVISATGGDASPLVDYEYECNCN